MMNDKYAEMMSRWLDDELNPDEVSELQVYLAQNEGGRRRYEAMQQVDHLLREAAGSHVAPPSGFVRRFETHLAQRQARKPWQIWLALSALMVGTFLLAAVWALMNGLTPMSVSVAALDASLLYQGILTIIDSAAGLRTFFLIGVLVAKGAIIIVGQPLFWVFVLISICTTWLWVRLLQTLSRRAANPMELML